MTTSGVPTVN